MKVFGVKMFSRTFIGGRADPLVIRHILIRFKAWGIYVHKFCRSDYDRALHDHPWPFISILLKGGYWEIHTQTPTGQQVREWRPQGSVLLRPGSWRHRVEIDKPVWSLIFVGRRFQRWGFYLPDGWCWWRKHNGALNICEDDVIYTGGKD